MTHFSRLLTTLVGTATGIYFLLLTSALLQSTTFHVWYERTSYAAFTLSAAFLLFFFAILFLLPTARGKLIFVMYNWVIRISVASVFLTVFGFAFLVMDAENLSGNPLLLNASHSVVMISSYILYAAFVITFILPGFAYSEVRKADREAQVTRSTGANQMAQQADVARGPVARLLVNVLWFLCFTIVCIGIYGDSHANFIASPAHADYVAENKIWILLGFGAIIFTTIFFSRQGPGPIRNPFVGFVLMILFCGAGSFLALPTARSGIPALLSLSEKGLYDRIQVAVVAQGHGEARRACDYRATVTWDGQERELCDVPTHIWPKLVPGRELILYGFLTDYGFRYKRVKLVR